MVLNKEAYRKGLSKKESILISTLSSRDRKIFTIDEAEEILGKDAKKFMSSLIRKKWVLQLKRGLYAIVPLDIGIKGAESFIIHDFVIASYLVKPYYIGFWSSLNYNGLSDQIPTTIFIATSKAKPPLNILNSRFLFIQLSRNKFIGIEEVEIEGYRVNISDRNKTIVDCLDHSEHSGGIDEIAKAIYFYHEELDFRKVKEYALKMKNITIFKRLGYILDRAGLLEKYDWIFKDIKLTKGYPCLDKIGGRKGKYNDKWKLIINTEIRPEGWMY
ncbi:MAG: type IV toxin-antitoxin system AbiEi family antitoxin domain-containing protein [Candidatus Lokiarchaeia archaeon]